MTVITSLCLHYMHRSVPSDPQLIISNEITNATLFHYTTISKCICFSEILMMVNNHMPPLPPLPPDVPNPVNNNPTSSSPPHKRTESKTPVLHPSVPKKAETSKTTKQKSITNMPLPPGMMSTDLETIESPPSGSPTPPPMEVHHKKRKTPPPTKKGIKDLPMPPRK